MTVRRKILAVLAFAALWLGAGCGGGEHSPVAAETDEPAYKEAKRLENAGRYPEALAAYRRVIEKRGEQNSAESHLDVGIIYLERIKNPIRAIYHFQQYLELQPNSKRAGLVRGQIRAAERSYALTLRGPNPLDAVQPDLQDQLERQQREIEMLRAALQAAPGGGGALPVIRLPNAAGEFDSPGLRAVPPPAPSSAAPEVISPLSPAPMPPSERTGGAGGGFVIAARPPAPKAAPPPAKPSATAPSAGRRHTIEAKDTLYKISVKYFGNGSKVDDIFNANRDVMPNKNTLPRIGTELKIP